MWQKYVEFVLKECPDVEHLANIGMAEANCYEAETDKELLERNENKAIRRYAITGSRYTTEGIKEFIDALQNDENLKDLTTPEEKQNITKMAMSCRLDIVTRVLNNEFSPEVFGVNSAEYELYDKLSKIADSGKVDVEKYKMSKKDYMEKVRTQVSFPVIDKAKKPNTKVMKEFLSSKNILPKESVLIGDRPLTDILAGKFLGSMTILVDSITKDTENKLTRIVRALERSVIKK